MKEIIDNNRILIVLLGLTFLFSSCDYDELRDADYPDQTIYMPAANSTIYDVSSVQSLNPDHPSSGEPYRFQIDRNNGEFIVPLGIYRAGIDKDGAFSVTITAHSDVVAPLIDEGAFDSYSEGTDVVILPQNEYSLPQRVDVSSGEDNETFFITIDLEFLRMNNTTSYALGIVMSSNDREVNPDLDTIVVFIPAGIVD